ncbi:MAG: hypothetical protein ACRC0M_05400 [Legionella sp.]
MTIKNKIITLIKPIVALPAMAHSIVSISSVLSLILLVLVNVVVIKPACGVLGND